MNKYKKKQTVCNIIHQILKVNNLFIQLTLLLIMIFDYIIKDNYYL